MPASQERDREGWIWTWIESVRGEREWERKRKYENGFIKKENWTLKILWIMPTLS